MKLNKITCDLKYAERLKELGVDQTTSYAIFYTYLSSFDSANHDLCGTIIKRDKKAQRHYISTFTTDELLRILPKRISIGEYSSKYVCLGQSEKENIVWYEDENDDNILLIRLSDKKLPNALAQLLIWVLEQDKAPSKKVNKEKKSIKEIPQERVEYKRLGKFFYSFKYGCWFIKTKTKMENDSKGGYWHISSLVNESTKEILEEVCGKSPADLSERMLSFINNPKNF